MVPSEAPAVCSECYQVAHDLVVGLAGRVGHPELRRHRFAALGQFPVMQSRATVVALDVQRKQFSHLGKAQIEPEAQRARAFDRFQVAWVVKVYRRQFRECL